MHRSCLLAAFPCLLLVVLPLSAADLMHIDRKIAKEPAYKSKPKYCLLVFGPEAKTRVWLVQDGDTMYVDRNGNGDLTEAGKKVTADKGDGTDDGEYTFTVGDIRDGTRLHKALSVEVEKLDSLAAKDEQVKALLANPNARRYHISIQIEMPGWNGAGVGGRVRQHPNYVDDQGLLQFADRAKDAPIIHFGGPWHITLFGRHRLTTGRETDVVLGVGTPGVGPGSTAYIDYAGVIPETVYPTVEITYPPKRPGGPQVRERYELKRRC
jgi:hypothetical protein